MLTACSEIGPDDGTDPRDWTKDCSRRPPGRKALQLCRQAAEALRAALAGCHDEVLSGLAVVGVVPAPHAGRLLATVAAEPSAAEHDAAEVLARLGRATGWLRTEVAAAVHRRKAPELVFRVAGHFSFQ
jgi:ribosome-binding factor A